MTKPTDNTLATTNEPGVTYNNFRLLSAAEIAAIIARVEERRLATDQGVQGASSV